MKFHICFSSADDAVFCIPSTDGEVDGDGVPLFCLEVPDEFRLSPEFTGAAAMALEVMAVLGAAFGFPLPASGLFSLETGACAELTLPLELSALSAETGSAGVAGATPLAETAGTAGTAGTDVFKIPVLPVISCTAAVSRRTLP